MIASVRAPLSEEFVMAAERLRADLLSAGIDPSATLRVEALYREALQYPSNDAWTAFYARLFAALKSRNSGPADEGARRLFAIVNDDFGRALFGPDACEAAWL